MSVRTLSEAFGARDVGLFILNTDLNTLQDKLTIEGGNLNEKN